MISVGGGSSRNCDLKSQLWGGCTPTTLAPWGPFQFGTPDCCKLRTFQCCLSLDVGWPNLVIYTQLLPCCFYFFSFNDCRLKSSQIIFYIKLKWFICIMSGLLKKSFKPKMKVKLSAKQVLFVCLSAGNSRLQVSLVISMR